MRGMVTALSQCHYRLHCPHPKVAFLMLLWALNKYITNTLALGSKPIHQIMLQTMLIYAANLAAGRGLGPLRLSFR